MPLGEFVRFSHTPPPFPLFIAPWSRVRRSGEKKNRGLVVAQEEAQRHNCNLTNPCISLIYYNLPTYALLFNKKLVGEEPHGRRSYPEDTRVTNGDLRLTK